MTNTPVLKVAVNVPLSHPFDYLPPEGVPGIDAGTRVVVPFGRRRETGMVLGSASESGLPAGRIRRCLDILDVSPLLAAADLQLIRFTSDYYHHPVGEVVAAALPALLRAGRPLDSTTSAVALSPAGRNADLEAVRRRAPRQAELLVALHDAGDEGLAAGTLNEQLPGWRRPARALAEKGWLTRIERRDDDCRMQPGNAGAEPGPRLNSRQREAADAIRRAQGFAPFLLDGVTGSGKTEVYLRVIADVIAAGEQALILVPEIGLTPLLVTRLSMRLGTAPAVLHSDLTDLERLAAWRRARSGAAQLVVGTRSAVFTPMPRLGLVVVDEEHDHSLKQQEGLRYSARDLAIVRARNSRVPAILGSATPTLESLAHCHSGAYRHLVLPDRAGGAQPPVIKLVDLSRARSTQGLSEPLAAAVEAHLGDGGQALMFLNRRGFAPTLICASCSHVAECERCDSRMTVHTHDHSLRCHHCGASAALSSLCSECGAAVKPLGEGTQRLEEVLQERFPGARIRRIDSDTTTQRGAIAAALAGAEQGDADILVGTQMLSKGHHFPKLTLVGVVNADQGLFGTDFRAGERMAQSIIQVAGRAGRERRRGDVLIQTAFPAHPFWKSLIAGGYPRVAAEALAEREASRWPPFTWLALFRSAAHKHEDAHRFLDTARAAIDARKDEYIRVLGPVDAPMGRKAGRFRAQLLLQSSSRRSLHTLLAGLRPLLEDEPSARRVRWSIDVDPIELF